MPWFHPHWLGTSQVDSAVASGDPVSVFHAVARVIFLMIVLVKSLFCSKTFLQYKAQAAWLSNQRHT